MSDSVKKLITAGYFATPPWVRASVRKSGHFMRGLSAKKPSFVIIGTGRSGTNYVADYLTAAGHSCTHERYFTMDGPVFRDKQQAFTPEGDASWLAVPFLPLEGVRVVHQTRHPLSVIKSLLKIGFFHPEHYERHRRFIDFATKHFTLSDTPLQSAVRWYIEWNAKCMEITSNQYRVEDFHDRTDEISRWLGFEERLPKLDISTKTNAKRVVVKPEENDILEEIKKLPEYPQLVEISQKLGYDV